ncbi:hypothetical protein [Micromonospora sp. WMMD737]|uniref:hypothetical protein n=1 Tax=Micromonospora sp. WMMD737 TaxID=3404113 RepID=UPI003B95AC5B
MDDGFDDHPKVVAMLDRDDPVVAGFAIGLWTLAWTWAHRNTRKKGKTPGLIPPGLPRRWFGPAYREGAQILVAHGLWDEHESGGWMIHDFVDYLPTESTREARSEAGKRGAAARWGKRPDAGNDPTPDGKLPSVCHDEDGNGEASDGSRAPARRDPTPTPVPTTDPPSEALFDTPPPAAPPTPPTKRQPKRATRIPDDFAVTDGMAAWAAKEIPHVNVTTETAKFRDFWTARSKDATKSDWAAAWRYWMRNAAERSPTTQPRSPAREPYRNQPDDDYERWVSR